MKIAKILPAFASAFLLATVTLLPLTTETFAQNRPVPSFRPAPGPLVGAGLPALAAGVGFGVYWLRKRRRKTG
jgi:hypothetical protein